MRTFGILFVLLFVVSVTVPSQAGLNFSKKKETTIIKPSTKTFKKFQTKTYETKKKKKSKKYKTKTIKDSKARRPGDETLGLKDSSINTNQTIEQKQIAVETKEQRLIDDASVDQVADQNAATVSKDKKPKKKKKASKSDINKYSKVRKGATEEVSVQQAGGDGK